jgi:hypothetical protein
MRVLQLTTRVGIAIVALDWVEPSPSASCLAKIFWFHKTNNEVESCCPSNCWPKTWRHAPYVFWHLEGQRLRQGLPLPCIAEKKVRSRWDLAQKSSEPSSPSERYWDMTLLSSHCAGVQSISSGAQELHWMEENCDLVPIPTVSTGQFTTSWTFPFPLQR